MVKALAFALALASACFAQEPYRLPGAEEARLGADHRVLIGLPRGYEKSTRRYPLLITTDADYCFPLVYRTAKFLADHDELEPVVVVGLDYVGVSEQGYGPIYKHARTRDYTPTHVADVGYGPEASRDSGGADRFLDFVQRELLPWLGARYRVDLADVGHVGYSFGGLLDAYALLTRPGLFQRAIVVSPSLWYDGGHVFRLKTKGPLHAKIYWAIGEREEGERRMVSDMRRFVARLPAGVTSKVWVAPEETHHSVFPGAAMRGLRWLYAPKGY